MCHVCTVRIHFNNSCVLSCCTVYLLPMTIQWCHRPEVVKYTRSKKLLIFKKRNRCLVRITYKWYFLFFADMVASMKKVAELDTELTIEERNLLSVAYKNVIGARRASWRIVSSVESKDMESNSNATKQGLNTAYKQEVIKTWSISYFTFMYNSVTLPMRKKGLKNRKKKNFKRKRT